MMAKRSCPGRSQGFYDDSFVDRIFITKRVKAEKEPQSSRKEVQDLKRVIAHAIMKKLISKRRCSSVTIPQSSDSVFLSVFKSKKIVLDLKQAQSVLGGNQFKLRTSSIHSEKQRCHELSTVQFQLRRDNVWAYEGNKRIAVSKTFKILIKITSRSYAVKVKSGATAGIQKRVSNRLDRGTNDGDAEAKIDLDNDDEILNGAVQAAHEVEVEPTVEVQNVGAGAVQAAHEGEVEPAGEVPNAAVQLTNNFDSCFLLFKTLRFLLAFLKRTLQFSNSS
eukprot:TRINITY_DN14835_c0_g1_i8.p1 TRINITY_DN14835_c0_g1~~TRINITY_DN14835_c0_g1_i8.p1  ORF type:complete len:277 (-),score=65.85 TRINITY_DN14835_c0_g1_i8:940-1770(-)